MSSVTELEQISKEISGNPILSGLVSDVITSVNRKLTNKIESLNRECGGNCPSNVRLNNIKKSLNWAKPFITSTLDSKLGKERFANINREALDPSKLDMIKNLIYFDLTKTYLPIANQFEQQKDMEQKYAKEVLKFGNEAEQLEKRPPAGVVWTGVDPDNMGMRPDPNDPNQVIIDPIVDKNTPNEINGVMLCKLDTDIGVIGNTTIPGRNGPREVSTGYCVNKKSYEEGE